jgi:hypothetical protein
MRALKVRAKRMTRAMKPMTTAPALPPTDVAASHETLCQTS